MRLVKVKNPSWGTNLLKFGLRSTGYLESIEDLEDVADWVENGPLSLPDGNFVGYWVLRQFIKDDKGTDHLVSTIGSKRVFSQSALRDVGLDVLSQAIHALETGSVLVSAVGSDPEVGISDFDLAVLQQAYEDNETTGHFTFTGVIF